MSVSLSDVIHVVVNMCVLTLSPGPSSCVRWFLSARCAASPNAPPPPCWETLSRRCSRSPSPGAAPHLSTPPGETLIKQGLRGLNMETWNTSEAENKTSTLWESMLGRNPLPSTRDVSSVTLAAFLRPAGRLRPRRSSFSRRHRPPFLDFALWTT